MKIRLTRTAYLLLLLFCASLLCACGKGNRLERLKYKKEIIKQRADKDRFFGESSNSPLLPVQRMRFKGLKYFKPDLSYRLKAVFTPTEVKKHSGGRTIEIQTSSGRKRLYVVKGKLNFTYGGKDFMLMAYQEEAQVRSRPDDLFVPFTDLSSGRESYGGGRYIEISSADRGTRELVLDFNLAFNPYCAYNHNYSCPIPPSGNHLDISINAGEKKFH